MKKGTIITIALVALVVILGIALISGYNSMVTLEADVDAAYANMDVYMQRRADLIPNLVSTVKGYAAHEQEAIDSVTEARAKLTGAATPEAAAEADAELSSALSRLLVVVENYPELKASENFTQLADELSGTENRIAVARKDYNEIVTKFNLVFGNSPTVCWQACLALRKSPCLQPALQPRKFPMWSFKRYESP